MPKPTPVAIASESPHTVAAGRQIAEMGGNAVDIAVAAALTATVSEALMCSLGGSAFISIKLPGQDPELIDGADAMPPIPEVDLNSSEKSWKKADIPYGDGITVNVGHASVAVPGMLKALELAWQRHGSLPWKEVLAPAVELAHSGTTANQTLVMWLGMAGHAVFHEQAESREAFFPDGSTPLQQDEFYKPPHLDQTLEFIAREGADALYLGDLGKAFASEISGNNGYVTRGALASYQAEVRKPILLQSHGYKLALNPPPSIGGAMVGSMVNLYDALWNKDMSDAEKVLLIARIQRTMFDLRHQEGNAEWNEARAARILEKPWLENFFHKTLSPNTMHMSVGTDNGAVVAITMSNGYGSGISIPGTGIPTNNSLGEPELNPAGYFRIPTGGRLVSNMSPTVVWNDEGMALAMGSPGASRITTTILQGWIRMGFGGMDFEDMVRAPRLHVEKIDGEFVVQHEPGLDVSLAQEHFKIRAFDAPDMYFGALNVAGNDAHGRLHALADTRRHGAQFVSAKATST
jgi:gamma-glutamyltranspeptidase/glutathione hydrolase